MFYSESEARSLVIEAGHRLVKEGLIARTWGNISARISEDEFIITPSGMAYETLKPSDLVKVKTIDLSYEGNIKPSSEKGIHAISYILRPEVSFVIHTHQFYASVIGIDGKDQGFAAGTEYGLPGTDKLKNNCMKSIAAHPGCKAFFLQGHGALCLGTSVDDAFEVARRLEEDSKAVFDAALDIGSEFGVTAMEDKSLFLDHARKYGKRLKAYIDDFAQIFGASVDISKKRTEICTGEDAEAESMILDKNCAAMLYAKTKKLGALSIADANLQHVIYVTKYSKLKNKGKG